jgi:hypothetical protein
MKFVFYIASTMLIVLISQHSTMGLPVSETATKKLCSEGMEYDKDGICRKVPPFITVTEPMFVAKKDPELRLGECPEGMVRGEHGICHELRLGECPEGMVHGKHGICHEVKPFKTITELMPVEKKDPELPPGACPVGMIHGEHGICRELRLGECPEGMKHGEHGICHDVQLTETTTVRQEDLDSKENLNDCPKGTKKDEQGACQEIEPTKTNKFPTDPKTFLEKDGSCPIHYKMVDGRCLYIKYKPRFQLYYPFGSKYMKPKSGNVEIIEYEKVPIRADNSCPEGTEYSEYGFCQRRISPSKSKFNMEADGKCPTDFEFINGKCTAKNSKEEDQSSEASTTDTLPLPSESTTFAAEPTRNRKFNIETATVKELTTEFLSKTTSQPL